MAYDVDFSATLDPDEWAAMISANDQYTQGVVYQVIGYAAASPLLPILPTLCTGLSLIHI